MSPQTRSSLPHLVAFASLITCVACGSDGAKHAMTAGMEETGGTTGSAGNPASAGGSTTPDAGGPASAGSGGGPVGSLGPPKVGACDNLGEPGKWENILPKDTETDQGKPVINAQGLALDPFNLGTLWMGASSNYPGGYAGGVYKSTDCGSTWKHVNTGTNGSKLDKCAMWSIAVDPVDEGTIYVIGAYGPLNVWKSTNGGTDWLPLLAEDSEFAKIVGSNFVASITMDPNDHLHLVIAPHADCKAPYDPICNAESTDGGEHWRMVKVPGTGWGEATGPILLNATSWLSTLNGLWLTTDNGATWKDVKPSEVKYVTSGEYTNRPFRKSPAGNYYLGGQQSNGLIMSSDGMNWTYIKGSPNGSYPLGFTVGGGRLYSGDFFENQYQVADEAHPEVWTMLPAPPAQYNGTKKGAVALEYDEEHHLLYSTNFEGGFWRMVTP